MKSAPFPPKRLFSVRSIGISCLLYGLLAVLAGWGIGGMPLMAGFLIGLVWSLFNFLVLSILISQVTSRRRSYPFILLILCVKIPLLYWLLYLLLVWEYGSLLGKIVGISWVLIVIVLKALGALILRWI